MKRYLFLGLSFFTLIGIELVGVEREFIPTLTVQGRATVKKAPDLLTARFTTITEAKDAISALKENNIKMNALIQAMREAGLKDDELQTGTFTITPVYTSPPRNSTEEFISQIRAFRVSNSLSLRTEKIDSAGDLIDRAAKAGANSIDTLQFALKNSGDLKREAIIEAAQNAIMDANTLAKASNIKIKRTLSINLDNAFQEPPMPKTRMAFASMQESSFDNTPILSGQVESEAQVTVSFEIMDE